MVTLLPHLEQLKHRLRRLPKWTKRYHTLQSFLLLDLFEYNLPEKFL